MTSPTFHDSVFTWLERNAGLTAAERTRFERHGLVDGARLMFPSLELGVLIDAGCFTALVFLIDDAIDAGGRALPEGTIAAIDARVRPYLGASFAFEVERYIAASHWEKAGGSARLYSGAAMALTEFCRAGLTLPAWHMIDSRVSAVREAAALVASYENDRYEAPADFAVAARAKAAHQSLASALAALPLEYAAYGKRLKELASGAVAWMAQSARYSK